MYKITTVYICTSFFNFQKLVAYEVGVNLRILISIIIKTMFMRTLTVIPSNSPGRTYHVQFQVLVPCILVFFLFFFCFLFFCIFVVTEYNRCFLVFVALGIYTRYTDQKCCWTLRLQKPFAFRSNRLRLLFLVACVLLSFNVI